MSDIRHILFICSWYPNRETPALGNFIQQHAIAAASSNIISVVYARSTGKLPEGEMELEEKQKGNLSEFIVYYGKVRSKIPLLSKLQKRDAYRKYIRFAVDKAVQKNEKPDLLHVQVIWPAAVAVLPLLNELNCPLLISEHWSGYLPEDGNYKGIVMKNISKQIADKAALITVVSDQMEKAMKRNGLGTSFIHLANTVDTSVFNFSDPGNRTDTLKLLHVSMLVDREKNVSGMIRTIASLDKSLLCELHIVGSANDENDLKQLANDLHSGERVFFHGFKAPVQIAEMMNESDALVMFSHFEGMPVTIIEAQCCGLPVIATRVGAIPEMIDAASGILVDAGDEKALANAINEFSFRRNSFDRKGISSKATEKYSLANVGARLNGIYSSILDHGK